MKPISSPPNSFSLEIISNESIFSLFLLIINSEEFLFSISMESFLSVSSFFSSVLFSSYNSILSSSNSFIKIIKPLYFFNLNIKNSFLLFSIIFLKISLFYLELKKYC